MAQGLIEKWPAVDPATVAPVRDGRPDMYNHQATRFVSLAEAKARGWKHYWTGERCNFGHRAARYVANNSICIDCKRIEDGKLPIYIGGTPELDAPGVKRRGSGHAPSRTGVAPIGPPQPSAAEKLFLTKYAEMKDFAKAAEECGRSEAEFLAILSWNELFRNAVNRLEEDLGIARTQQMSEFFEWDDAKRNVFLLTYANTADMRQAQRSVGVTNVQFHRELVDNPTFRAQWEDIQPVARSVFDHAAAAAATKGSERMLGRVVANFFPEKYGENMKMDLNVTQNLNVEQVREQIAQLFSRLDRSGRIAYQHPDVVEAEFSEAVADRPSEGSGAAETGDEDGGSDPNSDLV